MVLDESMHKSAMSLNAGGGGNDGKEVVMEVSTNNMGSIGNKEGVVALLMEVSMVGMKLAGAVNPYRLW